MKINNNDILEIGNVINYYGYKGNSLVATIIKFMCELYIIDKNDYIKITKLGDYLSTNSIELKKMVIALLPLGLLDRLLIRYHYNNNYRKILSEGNDCIIKFKFIDDKLFAYDEMKSKENQQMVEIKRINGVDINEIINKFMEEGFTKKQIEVLIMHKEFLNCLGFVGNKFNLHLLDENNNEIIMHMDDPNINFDFSIFRKEHIKSDLLIKSNFNLRNNSSLGMFNGNSYGCDSNIKLLSLLHGLSKSQEDLNLFGKIHLDLINMFSVNQIDDRYLDWMFISSFFLYNREEKSNLPSYVYDTLKNKLNGNSNYEFDKDNQGATFKPLCVFLDRENNELSYPYNIDESNYGANDLIFNHDTKQVDYRLLFHCLRNSLAHSSYEVIDSDYIRIYEFDENDKLKFNIKLKKEIIIDFIDDLSRYNNFGNTFPISVLDSPNLSNKNIVNINELESYLKNITVIDIINRNYYDLDTLKKIYNIAAMNLKQEKNYLNVNYKALKVFEYDYDEKIKDLNYLLQNPMLIDSYGAERIIRSRLKNFMSFDIDKIKLSGEQINNILKQFEMYSDTFYTLGAYKQHYIVSELIRNELNPSRDISNIMFDIIKTNNKTTGSIMDMLNMESTKYIDYDKVIKATIIAYLNNVLLFNYNENKRIDYSGLDFSDMLINKDILIAKKIKREKDLLRENRNSHSKIGNKEKRVNDLKKRLNYVQDNEIRKQIKDVEQEIELLRQEYSIERENKNNQEIQEINNELELISNNDFDINPYILEHLRNSLAHGNVSFLGTIDIYNIGGTELLFTDYYPTSGRESFNGKIKFSNLISSLNEEKYIRSLLDNQLNKDKSERI